MIGEDLYILEKANEENIEEMLHYLREHENSCLFLLGDLEEHGYTLTDAPNSGNFQIIRNGEDIAAVFCLTQRGNLLVQSNEITTRVFEIILDACRQEPIKLRGLIGEWDFCSQFWNFLKGKQAIAREKFFSKNNLYALNISDEAIPQQINVRFLQNDDFIQWRSAHIEYAKEMGLPEDLNEEQLYEQFQSKVAKRTIWGLFKNKGMISSAELNAKAGSLAQLGGVFTLPKYRKQGFAKSLLQQIVRDCRKIHNLRKLVVFTDENNEAAIRLYAFLGAKPCGKYTLLFGE